MPKKPAPKKDRHKPGRQVRIPPVFVKALEELGEVTTRTVPDEVREAIRHYLESLGRWPPKPPNGA